MSRTCRHISEAAQPKALIVGRAPPSLSGSFHMPVRGASSGQRPAQSRIVEALHTALESGWFSAG
jgi:hypothetical protein